MDVKSKTLKTETLKTESLKTESLKIEAKPSHPLLAKLHAAAKKKRRTIILADAEDERALVAAAAVERRGLANLILIGDENRIAKLLKKLKLALKSPVIDPQAYEFSDELVGKLVKVRKKKGMTPAKARALLKDQNYLAAMLVKTGAADAWVAGNRSTSADSIRPALQLWSGLTFSYFIMLPSKTGLGQKSSALIFADCALNISPDAQMLAHIAAGSAAAAKAYGIPARVALLSYSTHGSGAGDVVDKVVKATSLAKRKLARLARARASVDGPLQFDAAFVPAVGKQKAPKSKVAGKATVYIFPDLNSANIGHKIAERLGGWRAVGPFVADRPMSDLSRGCSAQDIVDVVAALGAR